MGRTWTSGNYGDLNTLHWVENELDPEPNMVLCEVMYGELITLWWRAQCLCRTQIPLPP